jgi:hypothetical protein
MLGDDAALVQEGVAAHETRATGGSRASRRGAGSAGARTVGGACSSTTDCRSRAASTRCHCRPAPPTTRPTPNPLADGFATQQLLVGSCRDSTQTPPHSRAAVTQRACERRSTRRQHSKCTLTCSFAQCPQSDSNRHCADFKNDSAGQCDQQKQVAKQLISLATQQFSTLPVRSRYDSGTATNRRRSRTRRVHGDVS